jgi:hypothetical protein
MTRATALAALTAALLAAPAAAQDQSDATWGGGASPAAPAAASFPVPAPLVSPPPRANGPFSLELLLGAGGTGGGGGLRASLGLELGEGWRLEFGAGAVAENGSAPGGTGGELLLGRAFGEVGVARRLGRVEPWVAVGVARFSGEYTSTTSGSVCIPGTIVCGQVDGLVTGEGSGEAVGPQLAAGVRFAINDTWLAGLALRKAFVQDRDLGDLAGLVDPGAPWFGATIIWRPGGGR